MYLRFCMQYMYCSWQINNRNYWGLMGIAHIELAHCRNYPWPFKATYGWRISTKLYNMSGKQEKELCLNHFYWPNFRYFVYPLLSHHLYYSYTALRSWPSTKYHSTSQLQLQCHWAPLTAAMSGSSLSICRRRFLSPRCPRNWGHPSSTAFQPHPGKYDSKYYSNFTSVTILSGQHFPSTLISQWTTVIQSWPSPIPTTNCLYSNGPSPVPATNCLYSNQF